MFRTSGQKAYVFFISAITSAVTAYEDFSGIRLTTYEVGQTPGVVSHERGWICVAVSIVLIASAGFFWRRSAQESKVSDSARRDHAATIWLVKIIVLVLLVGITIGLILQRVFAPIDL